MSMRNMINWFLNLFGFGHKIFSYRIVSELPKNPQNDIVYIEGNALVEDYWYALFKCPCGCGGTIMLNLIEDCKPSWKIYFNKKRFSIYPSIWRTKKCSSHFWLKNGKVVWA